ncbi:tumor necrosis factor receptor superfamily member 18 [Thomomys bottae]
MEKPRLREAWASLTKTVPFQQPAAMGARTALCGATLLCVLGLGQDPVAGLSCGPGCFLRGTDANLRCCCSCTPEQEVCPRGDCECMQPEFHCEDPECRTCTHHPCPPGQEARPQGTFKFGFKCVDCAMGTFSAAHEGRCRPWADCTESGFITVFPGNKTHNALCSPGPRPSESHSQLVIIFAVAICILALNIAQLSLYIWQLKRQHLKPRGQLCPREGETGPRIAPDHSPLAETQARPEVPLPPVEDAYSCQFPEEERGERLEEKGRPGGGWV